MSRSFEVNAEYQPVVAWLLSAQEPWVVYNALLEFGGASRESPEVEAAYTALQQHSAIKELFEAVREWPPSKPLGRAYDAKDSIWKVATLADFGLRRDDERIVTLAERLFAAQAGDGGFLHGGFDHTKSWHTRPYECLTHVMTYALACFGYLDDARLERAYQQLVSWQRLDGGWHPNTLNLPGNAREGEPSCPFGTVNVLRAVGVHAELRTGEVAQRAADFVLSCWTRRAEPYRPVGFGVGSTWDKVQYPFVQYQLLKTVDTLSMLPGVRADPRYQEMVERLKSKRNADGLWLVESVNKPWSAFDFGQKKEPSPWATLLALRVLVRGR
jgi:hypothetical protein